MKVAIGIYDTRDPESTLRSLYRQLRDDEDLRGYLITWDRPPARPGEMGAITEAISVAMSGSVGAALAGSISVWLRYRTSDLKIKIVTNPGEETERENTFEVEASRVRDLKALGELTEQIRDAIERN